MVHDNTPDSDNGEDNVPGRISQFIRNTMNNFIIAFNPEKQTVFEKTGQLPNINFVRRLAETQCVNNNHKNKYLGCVSLPYKVCQFTLHESKSVSFTSSQCGIDTMDI